MLSTSDRNLEQRTLVIMSARPYVSAEYLRTAASRGAKKFSLAAVYKVLHKLQASGVVVKSGTRYSFSLRWVFEMFTYADKLAATYFSEEYLKTLLPQRGKKLSWKFSELSRCNEFWNQLLLALLKHTPAANVFSWVPYPWFVLLHNDRESRLQQAFRMSGRRFYTSFGDGGHLEQDVRKVYGHSNQIISFSDGPLSRQRSKYIDVVSDYVLTVTLDSETQKRVVKVFSGAKRTASRNSSSNLAALVKRAAVSIRLEFSPKKAKAIRRQLAEFFGVSE